MARFSMTFRATLHRLRHPTSSIRSINHSQRRRRTAADMRRTIRLVKEVADAGQRRIINVSTPRSRHVCYVLFWTTQPSIPNFSPSRRFDAFRGPLPRVCPKIGQEGKKRMRNRVSHNFSHTIGDMFVLSIRTLLGLLGNRNLVEMSQAACVFSKKKRDQRTTTVAKVGGTAEM